MMSDVVEEFRLRIPNSVQAMQDVMAESEAWLQQHEGGAEFGMLVTLAIEELVTNCIKYAYDDSNEHLIDIRIQLVAGTLTLEIADDGHPFDPLQAPQPDLEASLEERTIGGLGLYMLKEMTDSMDYQRRDNCNVVTLRKSRAAV